MIGPTVGFHFSRGDIVFHREIFYLPILQTPVHRGGGLLPAPRFVDILVNECLEARQAKSPTVAKESALWETVSRHRKCFPSVARYLPTWKMVSLYSIGPMFRHTIMELIATQSPGKDI